MELGVDVRIGHEDLDHLGGARVIEQRWAITIAHDPDAGARAHEPDKPEPGVGLDVQIEQVGHLRVSGDMNIGLSHRVADSAAIGVEFSIG